MGHGGYVHRPGVVSPVRPLCPEPITNSRCTVTFVADQLPGLASPAMPTRSHVAANPDSSRIDSLTCPPVTSRVSGTPVPSVSRWNFDPNPPTDAAQSVVGRFVRVVDEMFFEAHAAMLREHHHRFLRAGRSFFLIPYPKLTCNNYCDKIISCSWPLPIAMSADSRIPTSRAGSALNAAFQYCNQCFVCEWVSTTLW